MRLKLLEREIQNKKFMENFIIYSEFNSNEISICKKKIEYLENNNKLLNNNIINLTNQYNYNLWRKISNIILKNIFVILYKKNYRFSQKFSYSVFCELKKRQKEMTRKDSESFQIEINKYKNYLDKQNKDKINNASSLIHSISSDKERPFNLIIIKRDNNYEVKPTLCIEFLFFLKEKGNKLNHFDKEILDLDLFDKMNIEISNEENQIFVGKKDELENETLIEKKKYIDKINFTGNDIIMMLNNPEQFHKKERNISQIFQPFYEKMKEIESKWGLKKNKMKLSDLEAHSTNINIQLGELIKNYEEHFDENGINYKDRNKIENNDLNEDEKDNLNNYFKAKSLLDNITKKIEYYQTIMSEINDMNNIKTTCEKNMDELIDNVKNKIKNEDKIIRISDLFTSFKNEMYYKINNIKEYMDYDSVFNNENISCFSMTDFFYFLKEHLANNSFSIIKRDVTNFNFLIEVISNYKQFKEVYNKDLDIKIE